MIMRMRKPVTGWRSHRCRHLQGVFKEMSGKIFSWAGILTMLLLSGCGSKEKQEPEAAPEATVPGAPALATPTSQKITADAIIYPIQQSTVSPKISAQIKKLYVER